MQNNLQIIDGELANKISEIPEIREMQLELLRFQFDKQLSKTLFDSGVYSKYKSAEQIFVILQEGRNLGFNASESMRGLYQVQGQVQMYGSLKTNYLKKRGWNISFKDEVIENNMLVKTTCIISKDEQVYEATVEVSQLKDGKNNNGLKNGKFTKLRYEAMDRILKTQIAGEVPDIITRSEDDIVNEVKQLPIKKSEEEKIKDFIENKVKSLDGLLNISEKIEEYPTLEPLFLEKKSELENV